MQLADEFFLIAWDAADSGRPRLHTQATALGLAGALLGELTLLERITIRGTEVLVVDRRPVQDVLAQRVLHEMNNAPEYSDIRTWLAYLGGSAVEGVAARLVNAGLVEREEARVMLRRQTRYVASGYAKGAWPAVRVRMMLVKGRQASLADMALAALTEATGLLDAIVPDPYDRVIARRYLATLMALTPHPLRDLSGHVQAAVGDAVLSYRS